MANMLNDLEYKSLNQLAEILEDLQEEAVHDEVELNRVKESLARLEKRQAVRAKQIHMVTDELTRRNPA